jgi:hypothetical protein
VIAMAPVWGRQTWVEGAADLAKAAFLTISKGFRRALSASNSASGSARSNWLDGRSLEDMKGDPGKVALQHYTR